jgi:dihydropteroate synthase
MGVVNVTPDSFSDGGVNLDPADAIATARRMAADGAAIVDVGGESTRPGSEGVTADDELRRVVPVLEELGGEVPVSIDTTRAEVARAAIDLGAELVNDVTALRSDPELAGVVADRGVYLCLMHMRGEPRTMQLDPRYGDLLSEVGEHLRAAARRAEAAGVNRESIVVDPGIGFGKTPRDSWRLLAGLAELAPGYPVLIGHSRKSFLDPGGTRAPGDRLPQTLAAGLLAALNGAAILRVHDVEAHVRMLEAYRGYEDARG